MKKVSGLKKILASTGIAVGSLIGNIANVEDSNAAIVQWRNRVPSVENNPDNIGSYTNTVEIGNGGTINYDDGLDFNLDTSISPNNRFFVSYIDHNPEKVEYEFTQDLQPGESYTAKLSFENNTSSNFYIVPNTIEFLRADGNFQYDLKVDTLTGGGDYDYFSSGDVKLGELESWQKFITSGDDWRNTGLNGFPNGWYYGELTITALEPTQEMLPGDGNGDNIVDQEDYQLWKDNFGTEITASAITDIDRIALGDYNLNGTVDLADYTVWRNNVGASNVSQSQNLEYLAMSNSNIPEPTSSTLVGLGLGAMGAGAYLSKKKK